MSSLHQLPDDLVREIFKSIGTISNQKRASCSEMKKWSRVFPQRLLKEWAKDSEIQNNKKNVIYNLKWDMKCFTDHKNLKLGDSGDFISISFFDDYEKEDWLFHKWRLYFVQIQKDPFWLYSGPNWY